MTSAYQSGQLQAEEDFGLRVAALNAPKENPEHPVGKLTAMLSAIAPKGQEPQERRRNRLDREVRWGNAASPYATGASSYDYSGIGRDGAAI